MDLKKGLNIGLSILLVFILFTGMAIFGTDIGYVLKLWGTFGLLGLVCFPITASIFKKSHDSGWIFSKAIGLGLSGLLMWFMSSVKILKYTMLNSYILIAILLIFNIFVYKKKKDTIKIDSDKITHILITEIIFILALFIWIYIRGMIPSIDNSTEKYMDFGFMGSIMKSEYMPPKDIWLQGGTINYYYFGQYISGFLCKIAGIDVKEGYNLVLSLIGALTFMMPFSIGFDLAEGLADRKKKLNNYAIKVFVAIFMGISVCIGGTMHFPIYKYIVKTDENGNQFNYYYANGTRYIGHMPDDPEDKTNVEYPAYSSIVGDLHAHVVDLIFVFAVIAILQQYFLDRESEEDVKKLLKDGVVILLGIFLGIQKMTNYWDFIIYFVVISMTILIKQILQEKRIYLIARNFLVKIIEILFIQELVALPFTLNFQMISSEVLMVEKRTAFYQLLVFWGLPNVCFLSLIIAFVSKFIINKKDTNIIEYCKTNENTLFALMIGICAWGLVLIPEIVYVKDIYGSPYLRFNTMFKLTYEAFVLFAICTNYAIIKLYLSKNKAILTFGVILALLNIITWGYGIDAIKYVTNGREYTGIGDIYQQLDGEYPNDSKAIEWIKENISGDKVILEASSSESSYTYYSRISALTGNPTVFGWFVHEWLWRNVNYMYPESHMDMVGDVERIYRISSIEEKKELLKKYNVSYIYIGELEYKTYPDIDLSELLELGEVVYSDDILTDDAENVDEDSIEEDELNEDDMEISNSGKKCYIIKLEL